MFKKMNYKVLMLIFVVLLAVVLIVQQYEASQGDRSFRKELFELDTADVTAIKIFPAEEKYQDFKIYKKDAEWRVQRGDVDAKADQGQIKGILSQLTLIKPERLAAKSKEQWGQYQVTDTASLRVVVEENGDEVADFIVGKFSYNPNQQQQMQQGMQAGQPRGKMTTFVRLTKEKEVYAVDGYLKAAFKPQFKPYRDKTLVEVKRENLKKVSFNYPGQRFTLKKENNKWMVNGAVADSAQTVKYMKQLATRRSNSYVDDWKEELTNPEYTIKVEGDNFNPITLKAYEADSTHQYIITSTENPDAMFSGRKGNLFMNTFKGLDYFLGVEEKK